MGLQHIFHIYFLEWFYKLSDYFNCINFISSRYVSYENKPEPTKSNFKKSNLRPHFVPTNIRNQEGKAIGNALCNVFISTLIY